MSKNYPSKICHENKKHQVLRAPASHIKAVRRHLKGERYHQICNFETSLQSQCGRAKEKGQSSFNVSYTKQHLTHTYTETHQAHTHMQIEPSLDFQLFIWCLIRLILIFKFLGFNGLRKS